MKSLWNIIKLHFIAIVKWLDWFLGGFDGPLKVLITVVVIDYFTEVMCVNFGYKSSNEIGLQCITKKLLVFLVVGIVNIISEHVIGTECDLRIVVICFYISHECISFLKNAVILGLPVPKKIKKIFELLGD